MNQFHLTVKHERPLLSKNNRFYLPTLQQLFCTVSVTTIQLFSLSVTHKLTELSKSLLGNIVRISFQCFSVNNATTCICIVSDTTQVAYKQNISMYLKTNVTNQPHEKKMHSFSCSKFSFYLYLQHEKTHTLHFIECL